jgi:plasmid stability protein
MSHVLIRDLSASVVRRLKARARRHGRSLQTELKQILEQSSQSTAADARRIADRLRRRLAGRPQSDSGKLQAEGRSR